jgi:hypothetical protein
VTIRLSDKREQFLRRSDTAWRLNQSQKSLHLRSSAIGLPHCLSPSDDIQALHNRDINSAPRRIVEEGRPDQDDQYDDDWYVEVRDSPPSRLIVNLGHEGGIEQLDEICVAVDRLSLDLLSREWGDLWDWIGLKGEAALRELPFPALNSELSSRIRIAPTAPSGSVGRNAMMDVRNARMIHL